MGASTLCIGWHGHTLVASGGRSILGLEEMLAHHPHQEGAGGVDAKDAGDAHDAHDTDDAHDMDDAHDTG